MFFFTPLDANPIENVMEHYEREKIQYYFPPNPLQTRQTTVARIQDFVEEVQASRDLAISEHLTLLVVSRYSRLPSSSGIVYGWWWFFF